MICPFFFSKTGSAEGWRDEEKQNHGDIIPGIINTAPVPVICMSGSVNEGDGLQRRVTESPKVQAKEEGSTEKRKRTGGWKGEGIPWGKRYYKIQGMEHILWWLRLISIHIEHFASESRRVQRCMSVAGPAAWSNCGAGAVWLLHAAAKSMGGRGAVS